MNIAIVGLGVISKKYTRGIKVNKGLNLLAICDIDESKKAHHIEEGVTFYNTVEKLSKDERIETVMVATPPATHYEVVKVLLNAKKHVMLEKPAVLKQEHLDELIELANKNNVAFDVVFHWAYGAEALWFKNEYKNNPEKYGKILKIQAEAYDPYTDKNHNILPEKVELAGTWFDCGINCLTVISDYINMDNIKLLEKHSLIDPKSGYYYYSKRVFESDGIEVIIKNDWRDKRNHKFTNFYFENGTVFMNHTAQELWYNAELLQNCNTWDRLETHYENYLKMYKPSPERHKNILDIHKTIFEAE